MGLATAIDQRGGRRHAEPFGFGGVVGCSEGRLRSGRREATAFAQAC